MTETTNFYDEPVARPQRSTFLTVLCILSFIGNGFGIINSISSMTLVPKSMVNFKSETDSVQQAKARQELAMKNDKGAKFAVKMMDSTKSFTNPEKLKQSGIAGLLLSAGTLLGVILMWRLQKKGFYIYTLCTLAGIATTLFIFGSENILAVLSASVAGFFGLVFIVMYAFCLKEMK